MIKKDASIPSILVIFFSNLNSDPRVWKQIHHFKDKGFHVTAIGKKHPNIDGVTFFQIRDETKTLAQKLVKAFRLLTKQYDCVYFNNPDIKYCLDWLKDRHYDLIVANDIEALPFAITARKNGKILFDAHEYSPLEFEDKWMWKFFFKIINIFFVPTTSQKSMR